MKLPKAVKEIEKLLNICANAGILVSIDNLEIVHMNKDEPYLLKNNLH